MSYVSSTTTQNTADLEKCTNQAQVIGIEIVTTDVLNPIAAEGFRIRTNGSTAPLTDIASIEIFYTGTNPTFTAINSFATAAPQAVGVNIDITGSQTLATGTNYFWVVYTLTPGAVIGNNIDAVCTGLRVDATNYGTTVSAPAGNRTIIDCEGETICSAITATTDCSYHPLGSNTGFTDSGIADPGCGDYQGGDVWYTLTIPVSGEVDLEIKQENGGLADVAMAAYTAPTCNGTLTLLDCDDNSGIGMMPLINLQSLTPGDELYVRIWEPGNDQTGSFSFQPTDATQIYCLTDDAYSFQADTCYHITADANGQLGCSWYKNTLDFNEDFDHTIDVYVGDDDHGADGLTFTFHNDPNGAVACGLPGGSLGADGLSNALSIEVDTYDNGAGVNDIGDDHIAVFTSVGGYGAPIAGPVTASSTTVDIEDGAIHQLRLIWTAGTQELAVHFDGVWRTSATGDFVNLVFGTNNVYWGSTGSTGGSTNEQYVCPNASLFSPLPVELLSFNTTCTTDNVELSWATASETNNAFFSIERSRDGQQFETITTITGAGTSTERIDYKWTDTHPLNGPAYYRISQTDFDGTTKHHFIRSVNCGQENFISIYPNPINAQLRVSAKYGGQLSLYDGTGKKILSTGIKAGTQSLNTSSLATGIYVVVADLENGEQQIERVIKR